jgi:molybdenum cofactor cytidylyltransferase
MRPHTAILLLAAGESSRLGQPKQLLDAAGEPLVHRVARQLIALDAGPVAVIVGAHREAIATAVADLRATIIVNDNWSQGIGTSIAAGIRWADADPSVVAAMIVLCDQPVIDAAHHRALLDRAKDATIVATEYAGTTGVPAVFSRSVFDRLLALPPDRGAKSLFNDRRLKVERITCEAARIDLDTVDDVARWRQS